MPARGDRFRQLRTPGTADLFAHFGVTTQADPPAPEPVATAAVIPAAACEQCGWYRPLPMAGPCPLCGAPGREGLAAAHADAQARAAAEALASPDQGDPTA